MADFVHHEACTCGSSDARAVYSDGSKFCFSCGEYFKSNGEKERPSRAISRANVKLIDGEPRILTKRGLSLETCRKYDYRVGVDRGKPVQLATYYNDQGIPVAQKVRYEDKSFRWAGDPKSAVLFGQQHAQRGGRRLVVTEGEIDAMSMAQAMGLRWPVVSVSNGASGAKKELAKHLEFLESYEAVILMFDNDAAGQKAAADCAELFTPGKCHLAKLSRKDPNEMLKAGLVRELVTAMWQAPSYRPDGLVSGKDLWEEVLIEPEPGLPYPWPCLDKLLYGQRPRELVTWTGGTGTGKSQLVKEIAHGLIKQKERVGIISLEESVRHAALCQMSLELERTLHLPHIRSKTSVEDLRKAFDATVGSGRLWFYDHFGSVSAASLLPKIRFMAKAYDVRWIILDHVSIMVSGMATEGDERKRIDELMTNLRSLVENLNIGMHVVSHLRKASGTPHEEGGRITLADLRGSGAIAQVSNIVIGAERNQQCETNSNVTSLRVLKNRFSGETGIAGTVVYSPETGRILQEEAALFEQDGPPGSTEERSDF